MKKNKKENEIVAVSSESVCACDSACACARVKTWRKDLSECNAFQVKDIWNENRGSKEFKRCVKDLMNGINKEYQPRVYKVIRTMFTGASLTALAKSDKAISARMISNYKEQVALKYGFMPLTTANSSSVETYDPIILDIFYQSVKKHTRYGLVSDCTALLLDISRNAHAKGVNISAVDMMSYKRKAISMIEHETKKK